MNPPTLEVMVGAWRLELHSPTISNVGTRDRGREVDLIRAIAAILFVDEPQM